ncbi:hypothetical protein F5148DRAFT_1339486 [Russula earlei]|uniref:Uncharacterized protein n=1 Tax=Russula earlei TaxID=71964 RepID=A0ACC0UGB6_9AGAM|nr:hypothetical protein F5148DRAFT_1339486 [Russula earlei]
MTINNDMSALVGFGCEAFFYGCYTIIFAMSIYLMLRRPPSQSSGVDRPIFIISVLLYVACSAHFTLEFIHFYTVLATKGTNGFANENNVLIGADLLIGVADFIGELILIYRCWLLWSRSYWIILFPTLTAVASLGCILETIHLLLRIDPTSPIAPPSLVPLGLASFVLPLCTNVLVTVLIAGRYLVPLPKAAIDIVIESGMLYLVVQLIFVILFAIRHPAQGVVGVIAVQIYGIASALIIIRVALGWSNTPTRMLHNAAGLMFRPVHTQAPMDYSIAPSSVSESGHRLEIHMSRMTLKLSGEDLGPRFSSAEIATAI